MRATRYSTWPRTLLSARMPFTVALLLTLAQMFPHTGQARFARLVRKAQTLQPDLLGDVFADTAIFLVQLALVLTVILLNHTKLVWRQRRNPAHDLVVGIALLKIGHQILHRDAAGG